ncbi:MAG: DUF4864 domain-containing protein [Pseudooceanicola sp.]
MARLIRVLSLILLAAGPVSAQSGGIEAVITDQMEDFRADDFAGAFDHASPKIRGMFGTSENFGMMVRRGYPMVHRPESFRFLDLRPAPPGMQQIVEVEDVNGRRFLLRYDMIETGDGWKIDGVLLLPPPDIAA